MVARRAARQTAARSPGLVVRATTRSRGVSGDYRRQVGRVQLVTLTGTPTGGTFTISYGGNTTTALAYNAAAATIQTAVR